jgi:CO/xanthine dehydrogenase FAD-binding subunit
MKPFTYERAQSPAQAAASAARAGGAKFVAGGTNLLDLMKLQIETPAHLIDVNRLALDKIEPTSDGGLRIGALVRNTDLAADPRIRRDYGLLARALLSGANGQLRNRIPTSPATNASPVAGAERSAASAATMPLSARATPALRPTRVTWPWRCAPLTLW